ncbi:hypothetical protein V2A60_008331 [Cordyceps javanica]
MDQQQHYYPQEQHQHPQRHHDHSHHHHHRQQQHQLLPFGYLSQMTNPYFTTDDDDDNDDVMTTTFSPSLLLLPVTTAGFPSAPSPQQQQPQQQQEQRPLASPPSNTTITITTTYLPDCFRTLRCDGCEMLFAEAAAGEPRWTFPCGHVYCGECMRRARSAARHTNVHALCRRCANIIVRKRDNAPCTHPIPVVSFDPRRRPLLPLPPSTTASTPTTTTGAVAGGDDDDEDDDDKDDDNHNGQLFPDRYRLALGQRTGPKCQLCWLVTRLQSLTYRLAQRYPVRGGGGGGSGHVDDNDDDEHGWGGFPGELFACVQVDRRRIVHGMRAELPEAKVDQHDDVELCRAPLRDELDRLASDICGGLGQVPMEPNFDPRGDVEVQYRLRGFGRWMRERQGRGGGGDDGEGDEGDEERARRSLPAALRMAVYGEW